MIKSISVTNENNETLLLELTAPGNSGFVLLGAEGLGPPKAVINTTELATNDGAVYNSAKATSRNILLYLKFLWKPTIEAMRRESYRFFRVKSEVKITIETDERTVETYGRIESNEVSIFSSSEGSQISIICPDPYMYSEETTVTTLSGIEDLFEFEFSNESLTEDLIVFGNIQSNEGQNIYYDGDSPIGIDIYIKTNGDVTNLTIYNSNTRELMTINTDKLGGPLIAGDKVHISTRRGNKRVILTRSGVDSNIMNALDFPITWFTLQRGDNVFAFKADSGESNVEMTIENKTIYEGV